MSEMESEALVESEVIEGNVLDLGLLIDTIQNYEFLYNLTHKDYKDSKKKQRAWEEIAMILNNTVEMCQKQWKSLRDKFVKEKRAKSGSGAPESDWIYFPNMLFYAKYTKPRKTYCTTKPSAEKPESSASESRPSSGASVWSTVEAIFSPTPSIEEDEPQLLVVTPSTSKSTNEPELVATPSTSEGFAGKAAGKKRKADSEIEGIMEVAKKLCSTLSTSSNLGNANKKFTEYIYARLEEMSPEEAGERRKEIWNILEK